MSGPQTHTVVLFTVHGVEVKRAAILQELDRITDYYKNPPETDEKSLEFPVGEKTQEMLWENINPTIEVVFMNKVGYEDLKSLRAAVESETIKYIEYLVKKFSIPAGKTFKTDGESNLVVIDDPNNIDMETGRRRRRKIRKRATNYTPPKKKRKK